MKEEIVKMLFLGWKDIQGERRYRVILISLIMSASGGLVVYFVTEYCSYFVYQVFVFIALMMLGFFAAFTYKKNALLILFPIRRKMMGMYNINYFLEFFLTLNLFYQ